MSYINKFGEILNKRTRTTDDKDDNDKKLHIELLKLFDITADNQCLDVRKKRISNLLAPVDPKDAVTKAYLNNKIININNTHADDIKQIKNEIEKFNQLNNEINTTHSTDIKQLKIDTSRSLNNNLEKINTNIDDVTKAVQNHISKQEKTIEEITKKYTLNSNKTYMSKVEERFNKVEEYIFKWVALDQRLNNIEDYIFKNIVGRSE